MTQPGADTTALDRDPAGASAANGPEDLEDFALQDDYALNPEYVERVIDAADGSAESGTESIMRWGLLQTGLVFEAQKWLTSRIRVDFFVAGFIAVECVSFEHHGSARDYENDRHRISEIVRLGNVVLEFTYHQVVFDWPATLATIMCAVVRG